MVRPPDKMRSYANRIGNYAYALPKYIYHSHFVVSQDRGAHNNAFQLGELASPVVSLVFS